MSLPQINGVNSSSISKMYSSVHTSNGQKYTLTASGKQNAIKNLEIQLAKGEITENEFNQKKLAINSAPRVVFVDSEGINHNGEFSAENAKRKGSEENKEIKKLQEQFAAGEITPFEYKANMYMMTMPMTMDTEQKGQNLSLLA